MMVAFIVANGCAIFVEERLQQKAGSLSYVKTLVLRISISLTFSSFLILFFKKSCSGLLQHDRQEHNYAEFREDGKLPPPPPVVPYNPLISLIIPPFGLQFRMVAAFQFGFSLLYVNASL